ncbi:MAG: hypothetical protein AAFQ98_16000 [Bacteroidota bacterium]
MRRIFVEGDNDFSFLLALGFSAREVKNSGGKSRVCTDLSKAEGNKGMVDQDPFGNTPAYMKQFETLKEDSFRITLHDPRKDNWLLVLKPEFEAWFLNFCKRTNIGLKDYKLSEKPNEFKTQLGAKKNIYKRDQFKKLISNNIENPVLAEIKEFLS